MHGAFYSLTIVTLLLCAVLVLVIVPFLGTVPIPVEIVWGGGTPMQHQIFFEIRWPRILLGFIAGAGLSVAGVVYQSVFRNHLACPFTLGVSSGAALGAALTIKLGISLTFLGLPAASILALCGALGTIALVVFIAGANASALMVLLAGLIVSFFCSSVIVLLQYLLDIGEVFVLTRWLMGGLSVVGYDLLCQLLPFVVLGITYPLLKRNELLLLSLGDELAWGRGVEVQTARRAHLMISSIMVGAIVALCGPIGFVGIMIPHACRLALGTAPMSVLIIGSGLLGGIFLTISDTIARTVIAPFELPVGVITALLGGPYFLALLVAKRRMVTL